jgi:hypothetical protein
MNKVTFKKMFPRLAEEMEGGKSRLNVNTVSSDRAGERPAASKRFDDYDPTVTDFLCRCDNAKQAEEIIDYMEGRGEIDSQCAQKLRIQLKKRGVRSFGAKREEGYYLTESGHK